MNDERSDQLTKLFNSAAEDPRSLAEAIAKAYTELREIAGGRMKRERRNHTLCATALINEVYPHLFPVDRDWKDRQEFFRYASEAMKNKLISYARSRGTQKRSGRADVNTNLHSDAAPKRRPIHLNISDIEALAVRSVEMDQDLILDIDSAISRLPEDEASVVRLLYYGGLQKPEVAETLGISESTVDRRWKFARALLSRELAEM